MWTFSKLAKPHLFFYHMILLILSAFNSILINVWSFDFKKYRKIRNFSNLPIFPFSKLVFFITWFFFDMESFQIRNFSHFFIFKLVVKIRLPNLKDNFSMEFNPLSSTFSSYDRTTEIPHGLALKLVRQGSISHVIGKVSSTWKEWSVSL